MRRSEVGDHGFVDAGVVVRVEHVGKAGARMLEGMMKPNELSGDGCSLRAAEAHDADAAATRGRGDGRDRVGRGDFTRRRVEFWISHRLDPL